MPVTLTTLHATTDMEYRGLCRLRIFARGAAQLTTIVVPFREEQNSPAVPISFCGNGVEQALELPRMLRNRSNAFRYFPGSGSA